MFNFTEMYRLVYVDSEAYIQCNPPAAPEAYEIPVCNGSDYGCGVCPSFEFKTGNEYNITLKWFPYNGSATVYLNSTVVASDIALDTNGSVYNYTITIPNVSSGTYWFRVVDNNGVEYKFKVCVIQVPTIKFDPNKGKCGDQVALKFTNMADFVGKNVTVYFYHNACNASDSVLLANLTIPSAEFEINVSIPKSAGGARYVFLKNSTGTGNLVYGPYNYTINTTFNVIPKIWTDPESLSNDGALFWVYGCGLKYNTLYYINVDNQFIAIDPIYGGVYGNCTGDLAVQMVKAGFRPGLHTVALYENVNDMGALGKYTVAAYDTFTVCTSGDPIIDQLKLVNSSILTSIDNLDDKMDNLNAKVVSIQDDIVVIQTTLGTIVTSINNLDAKVVSIQNGIATIQTTLGTISGKVTAIEGNVATIKTDVGTIKADVSNVKGFLPVDMTPVWIAVVLALIAAIASIYAIVVIRSKIAA